MDWPGILELPLAEQARAWEERRGAKSPRGFSARFAAAREAALLTLEAAGNLGVGPGRALPSQWLRSRGFRIVRSTAPARYGTLVLRAVVDLGTREVVVHDDAVTRLELALPVTGLRLPCPVTEVFLAHEAFHVNAPHCPHAHAELAAHLFCTRSLEVPFFAGLLDWLA